MKRIAIIGCGGAGKSTLARQLGVMLDLPVYHLDSLFWKAGWTATTASDFDTILYEILSKDKWIIDGNYSRTLDLRIREADTIIFLDYPTHVCLFRVIKRRIEYNGVTRPDMAKDCKEKIDAEFIKWILDFRRKNRSQILSRLGNFEGEKQIYVFNGPKELESFVNTLGFIKER